MPKPIKTTIKIRTIYIEFKSKRQAYNFIDELSKLGEKYNFSYEYEYENE
jgi:hypothetical protein